MFRITVIDTFSYNNFHTVFNASMLSIYSSIYDEINYYGQLSNYENIKKIITQDTFSKINFNRTTGIEKNGKYQLLAKYLYSAFTSLRSLYVNRNNGVVIFHNNNFILLYAFIFLAKRIKKVKIVIFCHGELGILTDLSNNGKLVRIERYILRKCLIQKYIPDNLNFIVLGDSILNEIQKQLPEKNKACFFSLDHPYLFTECCFHDMQCNSSFSVVKLGVIGLTNKSKGLNEFIELAKYIQQNRLPIQLIHIGEIIYDISILESLGVKVVKRINGELDRDSYIRNIKEVDYTLFLYPKESYKLTASGAIFEAINQNKPIISLNNSFFEYIFDKTDSIGYLYSDLETLKNKLIELIDLPKSEYYKMVDNMEQAKKLFSPMKIGEQFERIISTI